MLYSLIIISEVLVQLIIDDTSLTHFGIVYLTTDVALDMMQEYQPHFTDE